MDYWTPGGSSRVLTHTNRRMLLHFERFNWKDFSELEFTWSPVVLVLKNRLDGALYLISSSLSRLHLLSRGPFVCNISRQKNMRTCYFTLPFFSKFLFSIRFGAAMWKEKWAVAMAIDYISVIDRSVRIVLYRGPPFQVLLPISLLLIPYMDESIYNP